MKGMVDVRPLWIGGDLHITVSFLRSLYGGLVLLSGTALGALGCCEIIESFGHLIYSSLSTPITGAKAKATYPAFLFSMEAIECWIAFQMELVWPANQNAKMVSCCELSAVALSLWRENRDSRQQASQR